MAELLINAGTYSRLIRLVLVYIAVDSSANVLGLEVWKLEDGCAERDSLTRKYSEYPAKLEHPDADAVEAGYKETQFIPQTPPKA